MEDPEDNPGLVADCTTLVAVRNHFMSIQPNAEIDWNTPWKETRTKNGRVVSLDLVVATGSIPAELGNLTNLTSLSLSSNQLTGSIPAELGNLTNLTSLSLSSYQLTGTIPAELGNLTNLTWLRLSNNQLSGPIPAELNKLTNLEYLDLSGNQLTGLIPAELGNLTNLTGLELNGNQLSGPIPAELGKLTNLTSLSLNAMYWDSSSKQFTGGNQLTGTIPPELSRLTNLTSLELEGNQLTGEIPAELGNLTNLSTLWLYGNQLTGEIPAELGKLTNLISLSLSDNQLTGTIPTELANLANLEWLGLDGNQLTGEIPASLKVIQRFLFCPNRLTGTLPSQLRGVADSFGGDPDDIGPFCNFKGTFSDDEGSVHEDSIEQIAQWDIITGCKYRRFCPSKTVTRAQMAAFLHRAADHLYGTPDPGSETPLSDVADDAWYRTNAQWAVNNGVIRAPGGNFDPDGAVTRADMAEMLVAAFTHLTAPAQAQGLFSDVADSSDAAVRAMEGIHAAGVTTGCATEPLRYCPDKTVTRAQMASFLARAVQSADANP